MRWSAAVAVLAMVLAACGGDDADDDGGDASATTTTAEPGESEPDGSGGTEPLTPEDEVLAAHKEAMDALAAAHAVPDSEHPDLLALWGPPALTHIQVNLENYELNGHANIGDAEFHDPVVRLDPDDPDAAWVEVCIKSMTYDIDAGTREPIDGVRGEEDANVWRVRDRLQRIDGVWMVVENELRELDACTPG